MDVVAALARLGGTATTAQLVELVGRRAVAGALARGEVTRPARGVYALATAPPALQAAAGLRGVASHDSAAQLLFLETVQAPTQAHVTVPRHARRRSIPPGVQPHWASLTEDDVRGGVTTALRTVLDCARTLPFREALAVADSALRREAVTAAQLTAAAELLRGAGRGQVLRVIRHADGRAANPFESALRGTVLEAGLTTFEPQVRLRGRVAVRVDLADRRRRIVLEADSFAWHGSRAALARDCRRYDELVAGGWLVLRFAWEQVMFDEPWVARTVQAAVRLRDRAPLPLPRSA